MEVWRLYKQNKGKMMDNYIYTQSSTDITLRWRKLYGYIPASERASYQRKWKKFKEQFVKTVDDIETPEQPGVLKWKKQK